LSTQETSPTGVGLPGESEILKEINVVIASGALGRSRNYAAILRYLEQYSESGEQPKEYSIAVDVLGRGAEFDVNNDSVVRVYMHNLRKKLSAYYQDIAPERPVRLNIPKGQYRVELISNFNSQPPPEPRKDMKRFGLIAASLSMLLTIAFLLSYLLLGANSFESRYQKTLSHSIWQSITDDPFPVLLVLGDYFIFSESDKENGTQRLVREFFINTPRQLGDHIRSNSNENITYSNLNLTYLPRASAFSITEILPLLTATNKVVNVRMMSELNSADLKSNHIIYIGYLSALGPLLDLTLASSAFYIGSTFDELVRLDSGEAYISGEINSADAPNFRDYSFLSTYPTPDGTQIVIVSGTRDAGVMHSARSIRSDRFLESLSKNVPASKASKLPAWESIHEVFGIDRLNFDAREIYSGTLDQQQIWGGQLIELEK